MSTSGRTRVANGESSIYQDGAGKWHGWVTMGVRNDGRPDRRHRQGATRKAVAKKVAELEKQRAAGVVSAAGQRMTVGVWLAYWLDTIAAAKVTEKSLAGYRTLVDLHMIPGLGGHRLERLQPEHIETFYRGLSEGGMAPASVLKVHRVLSRALKVAVQRDKVARNPCALVDAPAVEKDETQALTADQARAVLGAALRDRLAARWAFAMEVGCRQGEALGLQWADLRLDFTTGHGTAVIRRQLQRSVSRHGCADREKCPARQPIRCPQAIGGGLVLVPTKSKRPRQVALSPFLVTAFMYHRDAQERERLAAGSVWAPDTHGDLVFRQPAGRPLDPRADYEAWVRLLDLAGVPRAGTHRARHTAASLLLEAGVPARVVMEVLGHSQISTTMNTYAHVSRPMTADAAERIGGVLWSTTATETATAPTEWDGEGGT